MTTKKINISAYSPISYHIDSLINDRIKVTMGGPIIFASDHTSMLVTTFYNDLEEYLISLGGFASLGTVFEIYYDWKLIATLELEDWKSFKDNRNDFYGIAIKGKIKDNIDHSEEKGGHYYVQED